MAKKPLEKVIADLKTSHPNGYYDYSLITEENYIDTHHHVSIICNKCGKVFRQTPHAHKRGQGCRVCANAARSEKHKNIPNKLSRGYTCGVGVFDLNLSCHNEDIHDAYCCWVSMLRRCYDNKYHLLKPTYKDCVVCDEWRYFSKFKRWFDENNIKGYHLDKDILIKGNKYYSPETCCFVPPEINTLLLNDKSKRNKKELPVGVSKCGNGYRSRISCKNKIIEIGTFDTPEEAFYAYKEAKEAYIKEVAQEYFDKGRITKRVYDALMKYEVEITD